MSVVYFKHLKGGGGKLRGFKGFREGNLLNFKNFERVKCGVWKFERRVNIPLPQPLDVYGCKAVNLHLWQNMVGWYFNLGVLTPTPPKTATIDDNEVTFLFMSYYTPQKLKPLLDVKVLSKPLIKRSYLFLEVILCMFWWKLIL